LDVKVVHLITGLTVGGAETMLAKLVSTMDRRAFRNQVVTLWEGGPVADDIRRAGIPVTSLGMVRGAPQPRGVARLVSLLRRERPDVLQTWMYHANLLGTVGARLAGVRRLAWNVRTSNFVGPDPSRQTRLTNRLCAALTRTPLGPKVVVANARAGVAAHTAQGYRPPRWEVIPNGFDLECFKPDPGVRERVRQELGIPLDVPVVGLLARFDPMKDHASFFRAASDVRKQVSGTHLLLAGSGVDGANARLRELVAGERLDDSVHLLGERKDAPALLAALDVYVSSSAYGEGFSNAIGEAMASGVPCVVTDVGDSAAIVGETGTVVPPRDPEALAAAIAGILGRPAEERQRLGAAARERVQREFSLVEITRQYEHLYRSLV
jgi:glycosyltransferase involved in cell wall biosynthesis